MPRGWLDVSLTKNTTTFKFAHDLPVSVFFTKKYFPTGSIFFSNLQTSIKKVYLEVVNSTTNNSGCKILFLRIPSPRIPRQVCRVHIWKSWYFCKQDIQPRGKSTAKNEWKYHKLQSSANFFAQRGFMGISNMSFLIPCRTKWYQQSSDINFFRVWPKIWVLLPA